MFTRFLRSNRNLVTTAFIGLVIVCFSSNASMQQVKVGMLSGSVFISSSDGKADYGTGHNFTLTVVSKNKRSKITSDDYGNYILEMPVGKYCVLEVQNLSGKLQEPWHGQHRCFEIKKGKSTRWDLVLVRPMGDFNSVSGPLSTTLPPSSNANIYNPTINSANNQFTTGQDYDYDPSGNVVEDATGKKFNYNGENKQTSFGNGGSLTNGGTYFYDGDGRRVKKIVGAEVTIFAYDAVGQMVAEYATTASGSPMVNYLTADTLGSPRVNTDASGNVTARHDYSPFGEVSVPGDRTSDLNYLTDGIRQKFTGYSRDLENELDFAETRYYKSPHGRFYGPDSYCIILEKEKGKDERQRKTFLSSYISQPQIWNKYAYGLNNPLKFTDPDGRRPLNEKDLERVQVLNNQYDQAVANGQVELAKAISETINEFAWAIDAASDNPAEDSRGLKIVSAAIDNIGNTDYAVTGTINNGFTGVVGPNETKCNIFVADAIAIGAGAGYGPNGVPTNSTMLGSLFGVSYPPVANDYADPTKSIPNFTVVGSPSQGDVAAYPGARQGHAAIFAGGQTSGGTEIYAGPGGVKINTVRQTQTSLGAASVTFRRFKP